MRRTFTALTAAFAVLAFSSMALASVPARTEKQPKAAKVAVVKNAPLSVVGKVAGFDAATRTLTVTTKKGDESFILTADTKIVSGTKAAKEDALVAGKAAKVAYTEANGQMTATKVTIAPAAKKVEKAAKKVEAK